MSWDFISTLRINFMGYVIEMSKLVNPIQLLKHWTVWCFVIVHTFPCQTSLGGVVYYRGDFLKFPIVLKFVIELKLTKLAKIICVLLLIPLRRTRAQTIPIYWPISQQKIVGQHVGTVCYRCWPNIQHVVDKKMLAKIFIDLCKIDVLVRFAMSLLAQHFQFWSLFWRPLNG